jgi:hypothetical protein
MIHYTKIKETLDRLASAGLVQRMQGNCVSSCDLVQNLLSQVGIKSKIVEVQLSITRTNPAHPDAMPEHFFIGYDNLSFNGQIDTHTVIITDTEHPYLIDMSIGYLIDNGYILEKLDPNTSTLADFTVGRCQLTYQYKKNIKLPQLHQKTLVERIVDEQTTKDTIRIVKWVVIGSLTLSIVNFCLNSFLIILKIMHP